MNLLVTGYLHPLKEFSNTGSYSKLMDEMESQIDYIETIQDMNETHDELNDIKTSKEALSSLESLGLSKNNSFLRIAVENLTTQFPDEIRKAYEAKLLGFNFKMRKWTNVGSEQLDVYLEKVNSLSELLTAIK